MFLCILILLNLSGCDKAQDSEEVPIEDHGGDNKTLTDDTEKEYAQDYLRTKISFTYSSLYKGLLNPQGTDAITVIPVYIDGGDLMDENTILVTNSSTLLPSTFAEYTGRPEKYLSMHFANTIWKNNTAEIMGHPGKSREYYGMVVRFAASISMVPLQLHKEQPGYTSIPCWCHSFQQHRAYGQTVYPIRKRSI